MIRTLLWMLFVGVVGWAVYSWATSGPDETGDTRRQQTGVQNTDDQGENGKSGHVQEGPQEPRNPAATKFETKRVIGEPLVVSDARIGMIEYLDVANQRGGKLVFLGVELPDQTVLDATMREEQIPAMVIETTAEEIRALGLRVEDCRYEGEAKLWRPWRESDPLDPSKLKIKARAKKFRVLRDGMKVKKDQLLGLIDPVLILRDLEIKISKIRVAVGELNTSIATRDETLVRYQRAERGVLDRTETVENRDAAKLTWLRYKYEVMGKEAGLDAAGSELRQSHTLLNLHQVRAPVSGVVRRVIRQAGEQLPEQGAPLFRIENLDRLQVEGLMDEHDARKLRERPQDWKVLVEPSRPESASVILRGHREPVVAVAVSRAVTTGPGVWENLVLAAGEDRTVRIWRVRREEDRASGKVKWSSGDAWILEHFMVVRSLSCAPRGENLCLTGGSDGTALLWDLDKLNENKPRKLATVHRGPILATAFSPDGSWFATGGDDRSLALWRVGEAKPSDQVERAHRGPVTSVVFVSEKQLVSAGRDNRLILWNIEDGELTQVSALEQRIGNLEQLGAHPASGQVLFDQGSQLRVLNLKDWSTEAVLRNPVSSTSFAQFAHFSPDGKTVLTTAGENRVQLWLHPGETKQGRAIQLREFVCNEGTPTCGAFDPMGTFAVAGTRDRHVLLWAMPPATEFKEPEANAEIRYLGEALDDSSRQVRILVDLMKKSDRLLAGDKANIIIYPDDVSTPSAPVGKGEEMR